MVAKRFWRVPTLRTAAVYSASGVGFAGANLVLARVLPKEEYALFTLVLALVNFGFALATAGIDGIVLRRALECASVQSSKHSLTPRPKLPPLRKTRQSPKFPQQITK